jgi:hypothetical protein
LTCLTFLETVQFDRLHYFLPKILALRVEPLKWGRRNGNPYSLRPNEDGYSYNTQDRLGGVAVLMEEACESGALQLVWVDQGINSTKRV